MPEEAGERGGGERKIQGLRSWVRALLAKTWIRVLLSVSPCTSDNAAMDVRLLPLHLCWGLGGEAGMGKGLLI